MPTDDVSIRVRLRDAARFNREAKGVANNIDNIGDQARQAARSMREMSASASSTRLNIGPFSTSLRGGAIAIGGLSLATRRLVPQVLSAAEAVATMTGGVGAAGGVGLLALGQAAGTVALTGLSDLTDALGGNEAAAKGLSPELRDLFMTLSDAQKGLADTAQQGFIPGLESGAGKAMRNLPVLNQIIADTSKELGGLADTAGGMLGSSEWGRDFATLGQTNVRVIDDLGRSGLSLADALKDILVEAGPLTEWLSGNIRTGSAWVEQWINAKRASGDMAEFFRDARRDLELLGSISGHTGSGLINLFGANDVDGTRTLRSLDQLTARFERWSRTASGENIGDAIVAEIPDAVGALATGIAHALPQAGQEGARLFLDGFMAADDWGKLLMGGWLFKKLGGFKAAGKLFGGGAAGGLMGKGASLTNPLPVWVVNDLPGGGGAPGRGGPGGPLGKAGRFAKFGRFAKVGGVIGAALTAEQTGEYLWGDLQRERRRTAGMSPEDIRSGAASGLQGVRPLSGEQPTRRVPVLDEQGFPTGKYEIVVNNDVTLTIDGEKLAQAQGTRVARRRARKAGTGFGGAAGP